MLRGSNQRIKFGNVLFAHRDQDPELWDLLQEAAQLLKKTGPIPPSVSVGVKHLLELVDYQNWSATPVLGGEEVRKINWTASGETLKLRAR